MIDQLTGLLNRNALKVRTNELEQQSAITGEPVAAILGDFDDFKEVNDSDGHAVGDAVLKDVACLMRKRLRSFDLAYRLGGDEFLVLVPGSDLESAVTLADELRGLRAVHSALSDPVERAEIAAELALSFAVRWRSEEAVAMIEESLAEVADPRSGPGVKLRGALLMVVLWGHRGVPEGALPAPGEAFDARIPASRSIMSMSSLLYACGLRSIEGAREMAEATLADRAWLEVDWATGINPTAAVVTLALTDRGDAIGDYFEAVIEIAKRRGTVLGVSGAHGIRCYCHLIDGELREAQADVEIALRVSGQFGFSVALSSWLGTAVRTLVARGELVGVSLSARATNGDDIQIRQETEHAIHPT